MIFKPILLIALAGVLPGLAFVFHFTRGKDNVNLIDRLALSLIVSPLILVLASFVEEVLHIPQSPLVLALNIGALGLLNVYCLWKFNSRGQWLLGLSWQKTAVYVLFAGLLWSRVGPALSLYAPLLHDPISHSQWLRLLTTTHFTTTDQWYPQGLEYYLNYYTSFFDISSPRAVLIGTNLFNAYFPVAMFYLGLLFFKSQKKMLVFPLLMLLFAALSPIPRTLYFTAGKNSMIFAFAAVPIILYLITYSRSRFDFVATVLLSFAVLVVHYPTGIFLLFVLFAINLLKVLGVQSWSYPDRKLAPDRKMLYDYLIGAGAFLALFLLLLVRVIPIYGAHPPQQDQSIIPYIEYIRDPGVLSFISKNFYDYQVSVYGIVPVIAAIVAVLALIFVTDRMNKRFIWLCLGTYAGLHASGVAILYIFSDPTFGIFYNFELRFFVLLLTIPVISWLAHYILEKSRLLSWSAGVIVAVEAIALVCLFQGRSSYDEYYENQKILATATSADLAAFQYIESNVDEAATFLIQQGNDAGVVTGADAGVWIPSFTGRNVEVDFAEFAEPRAYDIYDNYIRIGKDATDLPAVKILFCDYGIRYVYFGAKKVFSDHMQPAALKKSHYFEEIFNNGASIYRINALDCSESR